MKLLFLLMLIANAPAQDENLSLTRLRKLYVQAAENRDSLSTMKHLLAGVDKSALPVLVCYKGASSMIEAKFALNPVIKFNKFKAGKNLMEGAIARDNVNLEMRLLRYTVQYNCPHMLGYRENLEDDRAFLKNSVASVKDQELKIMIVHTLTVFH